MNKLTAGILMGAGAAGIAAAAYVPVKVGDTVQQQIELAVASANAKKAQSGVEIQVLDYQKNAYDSTLTTRITFTDPALAVQFDGAPSVDIQHAIDHGFSKADFTSHIVVTDAMKESLKDFDNKVPLHFDGSISSDQALINTYIEGFTLIPESHSEVRMKPGIIRLNYNAEKARYTIEGNWNGFRFSKRDDHFTLGEVAIEGQGEQQSKSIWNYDNSVRFNEITLSSDNVEIDARNLEINDRLNIQPDNTLSYTGHWTLEKMHTAQYGQTLYDFQPSQLSYTLSGPTVDQTEALMDAAQTVNAEQMTPEIARELLPVFADVLNAATFSLHDVEVVTTEGRIKGDINMELETSQQELVQAMSFPPILMQYLEVEGNAAINKSLFNSMPVFATMAMQLNQMQAYEENKDDMLVHAQMSNGQLKINDVPMR